MWSSMKLSTGHIIKVPEERRKRDGKINEEIVARNGHIGRKNMVQEAWKITNR